MKLYVLAVRDLKTDSYQPPFFVANVNGGIRMMMDAVNGQESMLSKHPADFVLMLLGTFDDETGLFDGHQPKQLALASELLKRSS